MAATKAVKAPPDAHHMDTLKADTNDIIISMQSVQVSQEITAFSAFAATKNTYTVEQVIDHLKECAEDGDHLDIYQITAFRCMTRNNNLGYYQIIFKAILAMFTQIIGMFVVLWQEMNQGWQIKNHWCDSDDPIHFKVMSFLFCITIIVFSYEGFITFRYNGMYRIHHLTFENKPDCINPYWISIGRYINTFVMLMVLYGSVFLVYFSEFATDIVLNSVAMFFMLELDDLLVNEQDYKDFRRYLQKYKHKKDYQISNCCLWVNKLIYYPFAIFVICSLIVAFGVSFVIAYCH